MNRIFSFDAESDGLWGEVFAIGAVVLDGSGKEITRWAGRMPDHVVTDGWVREIVLPKLSDLEVTHETREALIKDFAKFYMTHKAGCDVVTHMGYIVEAKLLRDMKTQGYIGDWDAPYPLFDVSGNLQAAGEDPTSVDRYAKKKGITVTGFGEGSHNPLYDAMITAMAYRHLRDSDLSWLANTTIRGWPTSS